MLQPIFYVIVMTVFVACSVPRSAIWSPDERTGLGRGSGNLTLGNARIPINGMERFVSVPLDTNDFWGKRFDLYYFVRMPDKNKATKTVLFIAGGPGEFNLGPFGPGIPMADFLIHNNEYNIVHFHVRGAGYSQIPPENQYDRFLKTAYVVGDIEEIRRDLSRLGVLGEDGRWDAIIGYSFGTVVAQMYASSYPRNVKKLILTGPQSRHVFENSDQAFSQITSEIREINRHTLTKIFESSEFNSVVGKEKIIDTALGTAQSMGLFQKAEEEFGSLPFLIDSYCQPEILQELRSDGLDKYSVKFFKALRELRSLGWQQKSRDRKEQIENAQQIQTEIQATTPVRGGCIPDANRSSDRVYNVVTMFDGINLRFLDALTKTDVHVLEAVRRSGGRAHYDRDINKFLDKVGIADNEKIVPWDPAKFIYDGPTMVMKGSADTNTAGRAAERFFINALTGSRVLIDYPGIGHDYELPLIPLGSPATTFPHSKVCEPDGTHLIRDCLFYSFLEMNPETFIDTNLNKILPVIIKDRASVCFKDSSSSKIIAGTCP